MENEEHDPPPLSGENGHVDPLLGTMEQTHWPPYLANHLVLSGTVSNRAARLLHKNKKCFLLNLQAKAPGEIEEDFFQINFVLKLP